MRGWFRARPRSPANPERQRRELEYLGFIILGGSRAWAKEKHLHSPANVHEIILFAIRELARQGTPRRWWSPQAIWSEVRFVGGIPEQRKEIFHVVRAAVAAAHARRLS